MKKTKEILGKINGFIEGLDANGDISTLESDLLKSYIVDLYHSLPAASQQQVETNLNVDRKQEKSPLEVVPTPPPASQPIKEEEFMPEMQLSATSPEPKDEKPQVEQTPKVDKVTRNEQHVKNVVQPKEEEMGNISETFEDKMDAVIHDKFEEENQVLVEDLKLKPVQNLKKEVDLNSKFWFINELFDKNGEAYDQAIQKIEASDSKSQAIEYIESEVEGRYDWKGKEYIKKKFLTWVERRFMSN